MPVYDVDVGGKVYEVTAPDPTTAWRWANSYHSKATTEPATKERPIGEELMRQTGLTARAGVEGLAGLAGIVTDPVAIMANKVLPDSMQLPGLQQSASQLLTAAGVPQPETTQERIVQQAAQALAGGGGSVAAARGIAGAAGGAVSRGVAGQMATQPAQQLVGAATGGGAGQAAQEMGAGPLGQIGAAIGGGVAGAGAAGARIGRAAASPRAVADEQAAKQAGIDLLTTDVNRPGTFVAKTAQQMGERIPLVGTGGMRETQQTQRVDAVKSLLRDFGADDAANASDAVMADLLKKRGADLSKYSQMKSGAIAAVDGAGPVDVNQTVQAIDNQIAQQQAIGTAQAQKVAAVLDDFKASVQGKPISVVDSIRQQIGKAFEGDSMADIKDAGQKALKAIYGPLRQDMDAHIIANGTRRDVNQWKVSMNRLAGLAGELENRTLKSVLRSGDVTPEAVDRMLFSKKPSDVKQLYASLTPEGRQNARAAILAKAANDAGGIDAISPDRFANSVKKMGASTGVMFTGDDLQRVEGLARVIDITKRAGEFTAAPPTGVQLAVPLGFGFLVDALGGMGAATVGALTLGSMSRLYEAPAVRNMLARMPKLQRGSAEEAALAKRIVSTIQTQGQLGNTKSEDKQTGKF